MHCPSCQRPMKTQTLDGYLGRSVDIDRCEACHVFWFDGTENLRLSPRATLTLLRMIGEAASQPRTPLSAVLKCPRCGSQLRLTHDRQRNVAFQYLRCPHEHGRLTTDFDFLREKNVVRPLSAEQLADLRRNLAFVNCSNCGAPVDLTTGSKCAHCGSALSIVDMQQAGAVIAELRNADKAGSVVDPTLPLRLAEARRQVDQAFAEARATTRDSTLLDHDVFSVGLSALARWLTD